MKEIVEVISEVNVDDIPKKIKGFENKENVAIIIGISDYREKLIPPSVKYAARDAEIMAKYLEKLGGIPRSNIKLLTDDTATKSDIEAYAEDWLTRRVNQDSTVFIYYAGHVINSRAVLRNSSGHSSSAGSGHSDVQKSALSEDQLR